MYIVNVHLKCDECPCQSPYTHAHTRAVCFNTERKNVLIFALYCSLAIYTIIYFFSGFIPSNDAHRCLQFSHEHSTFNTAFNNRLKLVNLVMEPMCNTVYVWFLCARTASDARRQLCFTLYVQCTGGYVGRLSWPRRQPSVLFFMLCAVLSIWRYYTLTATCVMLLALTWTSAGIGLKRGDTTTRKNIADAARES